MRLAFPVHPDIESTINNYDLFLRPNGVYRAREVRADNYLYPMYAYRDGGAYAVSTSVYALIHAKRRFVRNPKFQTTRFYRPSFLTIDAEVQRVRTARRRSTRELADPAAIVELGARLIQEYVTEIETRFPRAVHILLMGGKDSENILLAQRRSRWIAVSGEPNAPLNEAFLRDNGLAVERFVALSNETDNALLLEEILASDCGFDVAHFRWTPALQRLVNTCGGSAVIWMGTSGDGTFAKNNNHRDVDYYAVHDLHVGMAMGVWHQMVKNVLDVPVVSPYQSPRFLDELFYRFDPYFVLRAGDVRPQVGARLLGRPVRYPSANPTPAPWRRNRSASIPAYVRQLKREGLRCATRPARSWVRGRWETAWQVVDGASVKRRSPVSRLLVPLRHRAGRAIPTLRNARHDIAATEVR